MEKKFLDRDGVNILWSQIASEYPNNNIIAAIINAVDKSKIDKNQLFVGTLAEYTNAFRAGKVPVGAIVVLTDMEY